MASLQYVGPAELARLRTLDAVAPDRAAAFADACRLNTLSMVMEAGSGHIGTSFSCMDVLAWLHLEVLQDGDRYFSSKGHDAPGLYSTLIGLERMPFERIHTLRRLGGLPGHPDVGTTPEVITNTGSLGMGISKARGFVLADRAQGRSGRVFVLTGDGELQEGQFWESLQPTANRGLGEITVIVDHNKIQSDTWVSEVSDLGDLEGRVRSHGWETARCDGHDIAALGSAIDALAEMAPDRPKLLIADTVKGRGVSFMEPHDLPVAGDSLYAFHSGAPSPEDYERGLAELRARIDERLSALGAAPVELEDAGEPRRPAPPAAPQRLVAAYAGALAAEADRDERLVALDGDLSLDTGMSVFRARHPDRFYECGIAEQDMVSQAGAMALAGLLPAVHSFGCFLTPRANEQIFNNASEHTKVLYAGSLVGLVPGGPGHSHQMVRDIALMGSVPGMACLEPFCDDEAAAIVRWAVREADGPVYVRLVSVPWDLGFDAPAIAELEPGRGTVLREGSDVTFVCAGPILVSQAWAAAELLGAGGVSAGVIALPWLSGIDGAWLAEAATGETIVCLDNHVAHGGQGEAILASLAAAAPAAASRVVLRAVAEVPVCGTNPEVLAHHELDAPALAELARAATTERVGT